MTPGPQGWYSGPLGCAFFMMLLAGAEGRLAAGASDATGCTVEVVAGTDSCPFDCESGQFVYVRATGSGQVSGNAHCGGIDASCTGWQACDASAYVPSTEVALPPGNCSVTGALARATCWTSAD